MSHTADFTIRNSPVTVEFVWSRQVDDWTIGSWWTDNERVTQADVEIATDDFVAEHAGEWNHMERRA